MTNNIWDKSSRTVVSSDKVFVSDTGKTVEGLATVSDLVSVVIEDEAGTSLTELGHTSGVTSAIQTQIDSKLSTSGGTLTGDLELGDNLYKGQADSGIVFSANETKNIYTNITQGIYLLTLRGDGVYHSQGVFIVSVFDSADMGVAKLFTTTYETTDWSVGITFVGVNDFTITATSDNRAQTLSVVNLIRIG